MLPLSKGTENTTALHTLVTKNECFGAEAKIPKRAGHGELPFRNNFYMKKAAKCLQYEAFAAKQKDILAPPLRTAWN